jgi:TatD DNase family protein
MFIETHVHFSHKKFNQRFRCLGYDRETGDFVLREESRGSLAEAMREAGIGAAVEPAIDLDTNRTLLDMAESFRGWLWPAVGLHPTRSPHVPWRERAVIRELSRRPEVVAIGETGLDFHYPRKAQHRLKQLRWFLWLLLLAHRRRLPVILHIRQADREALRVLRLMRPFLRGGVVHCFSGDADTARAYIRLGLHLGIGGTLLWEGEAGDRLRDAVRAAPLERLLLETDAPYVHPDCGLVPSAKSRGQIRNTSLILPAVADRIAELKGLDPETVERVTTENARRLFHLPV